MYLKSILVSASLAIWSPVVAEDTQIINVIDTTQQWTWQILWFVDFIKGGQWYTTKYFIGWIPEEEQRACDEYPNDLTCWVIQSDTLSPLNFNIWNATEIWFQTWREDWI